MKGGPRVGIGWDRHRLVPGRALVLGGVAIPAERGALGHSDGDALLHAITDAVLGAAGLGDIGEHFPPSDPRWKDAPGAPFLRHAVALARGRGLAPLNVDAVVVLEAPRLGPHRDAMRRSVADLLGIDADAVSVKAKTAEGLGPEGAGEAVEAHAVVLLGRAASGTRAGAAGARRGRKPR